jgi:hypothetical protein
MANIITYAEQQALRPISKNNQSRFDIICAETEASELTDLLGVALLQDLQNNPATDNNIALLSGCNFKNSNGHIVKHQGIKYILIYLVYARYIGESDVKDTYAGMVEKRTEYSDGVSSGRIKLLQEQYRKVAMTAWQTTKEYLDLSSTTYKLWMRGESKQLFQPQFSGIKKTESSNRTKTFYDWKTRQILK